MRDRLIKLYAEMYLASGCTIDEAGRLAIEDADADCNELDDGELKMYLFLLERTEV